MIPIAGFENYVIAENGQVTNTRTGKVLKPSLNENGYWYVSLWKNNKSRTYSLHRLVAEAFIPNPESKPFVNHLDANRANPHKDNLEWCNQSENIKHAYNIGNKSQKQHFSPDELDSLFNELLTGKTMTHLATRMGVGLSRLTINLRNYAHKTNRVATFEAALSKQKRERNIAANTRRCMPVMQLDMQGNALATFPSATAAARSLGKVSSGPICNALKPDNPQKTGYGFQWKYI